MVGAFHRASWKVLCVALEHEELLADPRFTENWDRVKNREMWRDDNLVRTTNYFVVAPAGQTPQDQYTSRKDATSKIADAVLNKTVEGW